MPFEDLAAYISGGFELPVAGRTYTIPAPVARDGLWLQALLDGLESVVLTRAIGAANKAVLEDEQERGAYQMALGPAYDEMLANDVPWPALKHAGMTAWLYWTRGEEAAERYWTQPRTDQGKAAHPAAETPPKPQPGGSPTETSTPTPA